jgi:spermidine/putrescine transport system ATP-binding protein/putrescine transport system ATP-binding protein
MQLELRALQESVGITFIFVTHDQEEALTLSDRIAVMSEGNTLQIASPKELYNDPVSVEVADFIGQMNFVNATVLEVKDGVALLDTEGLGKLSTPTTKHYVQAGNKIVVAVRPEQLSLSMAPREGRQGAKGTMKTSAYLGDRSHLYVSVEGREKALAVSAQEGEASISGLDRGSDIYVSWSEDSLILLPLK